MGEQGEEGNARPSAPERSFHAKRSAGHQPEFCGMFAEVEARTPAKVIAAVNVVVVVICVCPCYSVCGGQRQLCGFQGQKLEHQACQGKLCLLSEPFPQLKPEPLTMCFTSVGRVPGSKEGPHR